MRSSLPPATWVEPVLWIPEAVWQGLLENFDRAPEGVERVAFLDGVPVPPGLGGVVTTLTVPAAALSPGNYRIGAAEMSAAGKHLRQHRLQRLAQVHTHGGTCTTHSPTDDAMAYSQHLGALSVVLPEHAQEDPDPWDGTVHVRGAAGWTELSRDEAISLIRIVPVQIDQSQYPKEAARWKQSRTGIPARLEALWSRMTKASH